MINVNKELLNKESDVSEEITSGYDRGKVYRLLPREEGKVYDNRIIIVLWRPAVVGPEIWGKFLEQDHFDYKAAVFGHWINDDATSEVSFVYCPKKTAEYYSKWLGKEFPGNCSLCDSGLTPSIRYMFQVFDYQKLIGERPLDEGEEKPMIQVLSAPKIIYNQLHNKFKAGWEFWYDTVVRITKDTRKGYRFADYIVELEGSKPVFDEPLKEYLRNDSNCVNPCKVVIRLSIQESNGFANGHKPSESSVQPGVHSNAGWNVKSSSDLGSESHKGKINW